MRMSRVLKVAAVVIVVLVVLVLALPVVFSQWIVGTPLPPLQLPASSAAVSADPAALDGTWTVGGGSQAGFRAGEYFLLQRGTIVGRTSAVSGSLVISGSQITSASFQVDLSKVVITIGDATNNLSRLFDMTAYPLATFDLTSPIDLAPVLADSQTSQTASSSVAGTLTLNNATHPVTLTLTGRYDGSTLAALGSTRLVMSDWGIKSPFGIEDDAEIELLVSLQKG